MVFPFKPNNYNKHEKFSKTYHLLSSLFLSIILLFSIPVSAEVYSQTNNSSESINSTTSLNSTSSISPPIDYTKTSYGCHVGYGYDIYDPNPMCEPLNGSERPPDVVYCTALGCPYNPPYPRDQIICIKAPCEFPNNYNNNKTKADFNDACKSENVHHWDKIIFKITNVELANALGLPANTELDIKVLDDPSAVVDLKQKVFDFFDLHGQDASYSYIDLIDVEYAIVCVSQQLTPVVQDPGDPRDPTDPGDPRDPTDPGDPRDPT
ncbi:MAG: hypothetical protein L0H55_10475, partial [Candidatus Nitrosocosmicus sp.]|nr:hypothetical protein [Candidatus Nitrosocosmicus sp.]